MCVLPRQINISYISWPCCEKKIVNNVAHLILLFYQAQDTFAVKNIWAKYLNKLGPPRGAKTFFFCVSVAKQH